jgi:hypothetical protein
MQSLRPWHDPISGNWEQLSEQSLPVIHDAVLPQADRLIRRNRSAAVRYSLLVPGSRGATRLVGATGLLLVGGEKSPYCLAADLHLSGDQHVAKLTTPLLHNPAEISDTLRGLDSIPMSVQGGIDFGIGQGRQRTVWNAGRIGQPHHVFIAAPSERVVHGPSFRIIPCLPGGNAFVNHVSAGLFSHTASGRCPPPYYGRICVLTHLYNS